MNGDNQERLAIQDYKMMQWSFNSTERSLVVSDDYEVVFR